MFDDLTDDELKVLADVVNFALESGAYEDALSIGLAEEPLENQMDILEDAFDKIKQANLERNGIEMEDSCSDELYLDLVEGGTLEEVKRINSPEFFDRMKAAGYPDKEKYQTICKECLAKKYNVDPHEFDFIQTFGEYGGA
jgi:hypothetical protein